MFVYDFSLVDIIMDETRLYLVFEFLSMDLKKYLDSLDSGKYLEQKKVKSYLYQVSHMQPQFFHPTFHWIKYYIFIC